MPTPMRACGQRRHEPTPGDLVEQIGLQDAADRPGGHHRGTAARFTASAWPRHPSEDRFVVPFGGDRVPIGSRVVTIAAAGRRARHGAAGELTGGCKKQRCHGAQQGDLADNPEARRRPPRCHGTQGERDAHAADAGGDRRPRAQGRPHKGERHARRNPHRDCGDHRGPVRACARDHHGHRHGRRRNERPHAERGQRGAMDAIEDRGRHRRQQHRVGGQQQGPRQRRGAVESGAVNQAHNLGCRPGENQHGGQQCHHRPQGLAHQQMGGRERAACAHPRHFSQQQRRQAPANSPGAIAKFSAAAYHRRQGATAQPPARQTVPACQSPGG